MGPDEINLLFESKVHIKGIEKEMAKPIAKQDLYNLRNRKVTFGSKVEFLLSIGAIVISEV